MQLSLKLMVIVAASTACISPVSEPAVSTSPGESVALDTATTTAGIGLPIDDGDQVGGGRAVAYVTDVGLEDGRVMVTIDFARMLTGIEAEQAARADGNIGKDETLPNDFYISNTDRADSRIEVASNAEVEVQGCFDDGACPTFVPVTLDEFVTLHSGSVPDTFAEGFSWYGGGLLYGIAVKDGVVTALVEQYLP